MEVAPPEKQAKLEDNPAPPPSQKDSLGVECYSFTSPQEEKLAVAFWDAKPWDPSAVPSEAHLNLPLAGEPAQVLLHDLLTGKETPIEWKRLSEGTVSVTVPLSASPKLLTTSIEAQNGKR